MRNYIHKITSFLFALIILCSISNISLFAQEDDIEKEAPATETLWRINGYIESENYFMVNPAIDASKNEESVTKIEQHGNLDFQVGTDTIHGRAVVHGFLYPTDRYAGGATNRLLINELYIKYLNSFMDLKIGRQVIRWGTADALNPTSYFAPTDLSEILLKDEDEFFLGVDAVSMTFLFLDYSIQLVCVPVATYTQLPATDSPWALQFPSQSGTAVNYMRQTPDRAFSSDNICYGGRFAASLSGVDFSFSGYHGMDKEVLLLPQLTVPTITVVPVYKNITAFGFDLAYSISDFTFQVETSYSFDKKAISKINPVPPIAEIKETHYLSYAAGINWLIDGDNFTIIFEFHNSHYLEKAKSLEDPFISGILVGRITKKFLNGSIKLEASAIFDVFDYDWMVNPVFGYDFLNGFSLEVQSNVFGGDADTLFGSYRNRDLLIVRAKYQF